MQVLNQLDRGWQQVVDFTVGDNVKFKAGVDDYYELQGIVHEIQTDYAVIEYYDHRDDIYYIDNVLLLDKNGYKVITKIK